MCTSKNLSRKAVAFCLSFSVGGLHKDQVADSHFADCIVALWTCVPAACLINLKKIPIDSKKRN